MTKVIICAALVLVLAFGLSRSQANMIVGRSSGGGAPSCVANITGSGANGNAILTGSATALANLTCQ